MFARVNEVQRIVQLVETGTSVEIAGTRWSGRSEMLRRLHERFNTLGLTTIVVRGVGADLPLEAIRAALPPQPGHPDADTAGNLIRRLSALLAEGPAVVMLDDADLLDDASWTVLESAHKRTGVPIVATTLLRPLSARGNHILIMIAHPVVAMTLDDLKPDAVHALLESRLGGPIAPSLSGRVYTKSAGIPGFALAIVDAARANGHLTQEGSVWHDRPDLWSDDLRAAYEALLFSFDNEVREALETLSMVGPTPVSQAVTLVGQEMVELLEGHGVARLFSTSGRHLIAVSPPGLGDYFRSLPVSTRRLRLLDRVGEALGVDQGALVEGGTVWSHALTRQELPLIARMFSETYAADSASAWREWVDRPNCASGIRLLRLHLDGPADEGRLREVVTGTPLDDAEPREELEFRFLHARWLLVTDAPFPEVELAMTPGPGFPHAAGLSALLEGLRFERFGIPDDVERVLPDASAHHGVDAELICVVRVIAQILSGQAQPDIDSLGPLSDPLAERLGDFARGLALVSSGRLAETVEWSAAQMDAAVDAGDRSSLAANTYIGVLAQVGLGRYDDAAAVGDIVIAAGVSAGSILFSPDRALMLALATTAFRTNRVLAAEALFERGAAYLGRSDGLPLGSAEVAEVSAIVAEGETAVAAKKYLEAAAELERHGYGLAADSATMMALLTEFDPATAESFRPRATGTGGRLFAAYLDARAASSNGDPEALVAVAGVLRDEQATGEALKHLTYAAQLFRDRGMTAESAEARRQIHELVSDGNLGTADAQLHADSTWGLTAREREIIGDVAAGRTNAEIAEKHTVSIRTVETHLRNIRRKTGAIDRQGIGQFAEN